MNDDQTTNPWTTLSIEEKYSNPWIAVTHREVLNPAGGDGIYGMVHFKNRAIGIVPLDQDLNTWLVGQYRYPIDEYSWEIPEGGGPVDTDPLASAQRELQEETGIRATQWTCVLDAHMSNSVSDERCFSYVARDLSFGEATPEETEQLCIRKVAFRDVVEMVYTGQITDSLTLLSVMKVKLMLDRGEL